MGYLTYEAIDIGQWHRHALDAKDGASVEFAGIVRGHDEGVCVAALEYDAYEPMAERLIAQSVEQAKTRWSFHQVCIRHRLGTVPAGELAVFVGVRAPHRDQAFEACRFLIEAIKRDAPIWKREHYDINFAERNLFKGQHPAQEMDAGAMCPGPTRGSGGMPSSEARGS